MEASVPEGPDRMDTDVPSPAISKPDCPDIDHEHDHDSEHESVSSHGTEEGLICDPHEPMRASPEPYDPTDPAQNSYAMVRARFEQECFKVRQGSCFARIEPGTKQPTILKQAAMRDYFGYMSYFEYCDKANKQVEKKFIDKWLRDYSSKEKEVLGIVCDPQDASPGYYNTWQGFAAEELTPVPDDEVQQLIASTIHHVTAVICAGNEDHAAWFLDWLAQIVQFPGIISQVAIMLYGDQVLTCNSRVIGLH